LRYSYSADTGGNINQYKGNNGQEASSSISRKLLLVPPVLKNSIGGKWDKVIVPAPP